MSAYKDRCRKDCQWCARGVELLTGSRSHKISDDNYQYCTAPTLEQFAEEKALQSQRQHLVIAEYQGIVTALGALLESAEGMLTRARQLVDGWWQTTPKDQWSEWDEEVRQEMRIVHEAIAKEVGKWNTLTK